jgi:hypothetical protein
MRRSRAAPILVARYRQIVPSRKSQKGDTMMVKYYLRYARYTMAALATVGFGKLAN